MWRRWVGLGAYTAAIYATVPLGLPLARVLLRHAAGRWLIGPGLVVAGAATALAVAITVRRRGGGARAFTGLAVAVAGYAGALAWLRAQQIERIHLPEYGVAAWLAWRALVPEVGAGARAYVGAAALASAIGWGDELLQAVTPGRVYDLRDVAANALGAALGTLLVAVVHAPAEPGAAPAGRISVGSSSRR